MLFGMPVERFVIPGGGLLAGLIVMQMLTGSGIVGGSLPGRNLAHALSGWFILGLALAIGWLSLIGYLHILVF